MMSAVNALTNKEVDLIYTIPLQTLCHFSENCKTQKKKKNVAKKNY
jgi:coproporphyrinogen III oxidase-like Fe-S oxidoreductase